MTERVVIVEDHGLLGQTLAVALSGQGIDVHVIDAVTTADLLTAIRDHEPKLALLDLDLGDGRTSLDLIDPLTSDGIPVVMVTGVTDPVRRAQCVRAGAVGIVDKSVSFSELLETVHTTLERGHLLDHHQREEYLALLRKHEAKERERLAPFEELTPREAEILQALMEGHTVDEIATEDVVSVATVRTQVRAILRKLGVSSQLAAVGLARRAGWPQNPR